MTLDDLLFKWARWRSICNDHGLGYSSNGLNRLMAGKVNTGSGGVMALPYGVDSDSVFSDIDRAVMGLPAFDREVLLAQYSICGVEAVVDTTSKAKAARCGCRVSTFYKYLEDAKRFLMNALSGKKCLKLLNTC